MFEAIFRDRGDAGRRLGAALRERVAGGVVVLGLPRGGVPVATEVAHALGAPLDVLVVRKLGLPGHEELAMGAVASGGVRVLNDEVLRAYAVPESVVDEVTSQSTDELNRRELAYRGTRAAIDVDGRVVVLVDDGLATGSTMRAAVRALRERSPARIVVGVPIATAEACALIAREADDVVCVAQPEPFRAVGVWYADFTQTTDDEVRMLLGAAPS